MKPIRLSLLLMLVIAATAFIPPATGVYRWDYKICIDTAGLRVFKQKPAASTIHDLVHITRPQPAELKNQRADAEKQQVTVTAFVVKDGKEGDQDYHLVLKSLTGSETLIAEIPDPTGAKLKGFPGLKKAYTDARAFVDANIDDSPGEVRVSPHPIKVTVTGIIFFDKMAHGNGHAVNGVEIHPVLKINKT